MDQAEVLKTVQESASSAMYLTGAIIVFTVIITVGVMVYVKRYLIPSLTGMTGQDKEIMQNGLPGKATIIGVTETGVRLNEMPQIQLTLEVQPDSGGAPYQAQLKTIIQSVQIPQVQPGKVLAVKISPTDPGKVVLAR